MTLRATHAILDTTWMDQRKADVKPMGIGPFHQNATVSSVQTILNCEVPEFWNCFFSTFSARTLVIKLPWPSHNWFYRFFIEITCGIPPMLPNGKVTDVTGYNMLDTVSYECSDGFQLTGPLFIWCQESGTWTSTPKCTGKCSDVKRIPSIPLFNGPFWCGFTDWNWKKQNCLNDLTLQMLNACWDGLWFIPFSNLVSFSLVHTRASDRPN